MNAAGTESGAGAFRRLLWAACGALGVAGAADFLFWGAEPGLSVALFVLVLAAVIAGIRKTGGGGLAPAWPVFVLLAGAAMAAAVDFGFANFCVLAVLFLVLAGETLYDDRPRLWARAVSQAAASLRFPLALPKLGFGLFRQGMASPWGAASTLARIAAVVVPALAVGLLFALLLGVGNAVFGAWFGEAWKEFWAWLGTLSFGRICFALFTTSVALTLLLPARVGARWWGWTTAPEPEALPEAPPRYLRWQAGAVLGTVNLLFLAANGADVACLWLRHAMPAGVNPTRYVHEGAWALITAVVLAGAVLAFFFRKRGALLPQRAPRLLAYAWIGQCLFLLASVALRLQLYVRDFGMTKTRVELVCFLVLVGAGFLLLAAKIARDKSLHWLAAGNAFAVFALFYAVQFWDMGGFVAKWNVDRWERHSRWRIDLYYLVSEEMGSSGWRELRRVAGGEREPEASLARSLLRRQAEPSVSWRSWQALGEGARKYLKDVPFPGLADEGWQSDLFVAEEGTAILLERFPLAESALFQWRLVVRFSNEKKEALDLSNASADGFQMALRRDAQGCYVLSNGWDSCRIDPGKGVVELRPPSQGGEGTYFGVFNVRGEEGLIFLPMGGSR